MSCPIISQFFFWPEMQWNCAAVCLNNYKNVQYDNKSHKYFALISFLIYFSTKNLAVNFSRTRKVNIPFFETLTYTFGSPSRCILKEHDFDLLQ